MGFPREDIDVVLIAFTGIKNGTGYDLPLPNRMFVLNKIGYQYYGYDSATWTVRYYTSTFLTECGVGYYAAGQFHFNGWGEWFLSGVSDQTTPEFVGWGGSFSAVAVKSSSAPVDLTDIITAIGDLPAATFVEVQGGNPAIAAATVRLARQYDHTVISMHVSSSP